MEKLLSRIFNLLKTVRFLEAISFILNKLMNILKWLLIPPKALVQASRLDPKMPRWKLRCLMQNTKTKRS